MTTDLPYFPLDPGKDYRWCDLEGERWEVLQERGWQPVVFNGKHLQDNELTFCIKMRQSEEKIE